MPRSFCTEGPIDKERNYYVPRTELLAVGLKKVEEWRYFTLTAPRQSGKSTYFQFLADEIRASRPTWLPLWISFEAYGDKREPDFLKSFTRDLNVDLETQGESFRFACPSDMEAWKDELLRLRDNSPEGRELVLIVDEIEGLRNLSLLNSFLHTIRSIYHVREEFRLRSVILVGVSNITGILQSTASPFNIAEQITIPYFTREETEDLLLQHTRETGKTFDPEVRRRIWSDTAGQPGLVNALARDLVEKKAPGGEPVTEALFFRTLNDFLRYYTDKNIANVVNKAKQHPEILRRILFDGPVEFTTYDDRIAFLKTNGVLEIGEENECVIPVPLYKKCLYATFKPFENGERERFKDPFQSVRDYLDPSGTLRMEQVLDRYAAYVLERGNIVFSRGKVLEGVYHYNLDAFLASFAGLLGGHVFPEVPEGGGRVDLLVLQGGKRWIVEVKRFTGKDEFEAGKDQLEAYLERSGESEGYYVVFSPYHQAQEKGEEVRTKGGVSRRLVWWILPVAAPVPSGE